MTPSSDAPPGMLHPPDTDVFPPSPPHSVPPYARPRWASGVARWWHALFARNACARGAGAVRSGRGGHRFFQHLIEPVDGGSNDAPGRGDTGET